MTGFVFAPELDMSIDALHAPTRALGPLLERVGTSQIAKFRIALGLRKWELGDPDYLRTATAPMKRGSGISKALLVAAGRWPEPVNDDETLRIGTRREPEIFAAWKALVEARWWSHDFEQQVNPASIVWRPPAANDDPRITDPHCPYIDTSGFDGDCYLFDGAKVVVDAKCARYKHPRARFPGPVWWDRGECPWWYRDQLDAIMSMRKAQHALLIVGGGWNRDEDDHRGDGPLRVFYAARDEARIADVRSIATEAVRRAREIRASAEKAA